MDDFEWCDYGEYDGELVMMSYDLDYLLTGFCWIDHNENNI